MQEPGDFIVQFPLYLVIANPGAYPLVAIAEDEESIRGVAMFTEELFAERARDAQSPGSEIWTVPTLDHLRQFHLPLFRSWGYTHVAIDTHEQTGKGHYVPIEDLDG